MGTYSAPPDPLAGFKGAYFYGEGKGRDGGREGEGRGRQLGQGREGEGRGGEGKGEGKIGGSCSPTSHGGLDATEYDFTYKPYAEMSSAAYCKVVFVIFLS